MKNIIFISLCLMSICVSSQIQINGIITDMEGSLLGATILVKETNTITSSGFDGEYQIETKKQDTILFNYPGYFSEVHIVEKDSTIKKTLIPINPYIYLGYNGEYRLGYGNIVIPIEYHKIQQVLKLRKDILKPNELNTPKERIITFDGIIISEEEFNAIHPTTIKSVAVLKHHTSSVQNVKQLPHILILSKKQYFFKLWTADKEFRDEIEEQWRN